MRIAVVSPYDLGLFGGVQDQTLKLVRWLREAGHDAWAVGPGAGPEESVSVGRSVPVPANGSVAAISLDPRMRRRIHAALAGAEVVHVHEPMMPLVSLLAIQTHLPSVGTFHADAPAPLRSAMRRVFGSTGGRIGRLDAVTAVSPVAAGPVRGSVPHRMIPNGIDVGSYAPGEEVPGRVVVLGRDEPRKGLDVFRVAAVAVKAARPSASLVVAGTQERGTAAGIELVGRISEDDKRELLSRASVFVAPHRHGESFGIVLVEAMAAGCAVVASGLPAFAHVLGDAGVLVPPGDAEALASAMQSLLDDHERRGGLQRRAVERAAAFDRKVVLEGYLDVYRDAISGSG